MTDADDDQGVAEELDEDEVDVDRPLGYEEPGTDYPPERAQGVNDYGVTEAEEEVDEPLEERVRREVPDPLVEELDRAARDEERGSR